MSLLISYLGWGGNLCIVAGQWGIGNKWRKAFLFSVAGELCWIAKSAYFRQWDLAVICVVFAVLAGRSFVKWGQS